MTTSSSQRRISRRGLLAGATALGFGTVSVSSIDGAPETPISGSPSPEFPRQEADVVLEVVTRAHFDLDRVRQLVTQRPALARASWDWGFGDWESALGAASHMGRPDIAAVLIEHGARPNLFTAAMTGNLDAVRAFLEAQPGIQALRGPHGLTLLHHARAGRDAAQAVVAYLEEVGGADPSLPEVRLSATEVEAYAGTYRFGAGPTDVLEVSEKGGGLGIARPPSAPRALHPLGDHAFFPAGADAARIRFQTNDGTVTALTVHDPGLVVRAARVP